MRRDMEHLLARQGHAHRTVELARRQGRQDGVAIDRQLAAEAAADILGDHLDLVGSSFSVSAIDLWALSTSCRALVTVSLPSCHEARLACGSIMACD